jgi:hypothetical protein
MKITTMPKDPAHASKLKNFPIVLILEPCQKTATKAPIGSLLNE